MHGRKGAKHNQASFDILLAMDVTENGKNLNRKEVERHVEFKKAKQSVSVIY